MKTSLTCRLVFTEADPALVISFNQFLLTLPEIADLATVLEKTATKWLSCRKCGQDDCDKELTHERAAGSSQAVH